MSTKAKKDVVKKDAVKKDKEQEMVFERKTVEAVFEQGLLYRLIANSWWGKTTKVPEEQIKQPEKSAEESKRVMGAIKPLVNPERMADIHSVRASAERALKRWSFPFVGFDNVFFVPKAFMPKIEETFAKSKAEHDAAVAEFVDNIDKYKKEWKPILGEFYDEKAYPEKDKLRQTFKFEWRKFIITVPDKGSNLLSDEEYKAEIKRQAESIKLFLDSALSELAKGFQEILSKMEGRLKEGKALNPKFLASVKEFAVTFKDMNITNNASLQSLVDKMYEAVKTAQPGDFKEEKFRETVAKSIASVTKEFEKVAKKDADLGRALEF
jgi:hypothetical protein